jgi:hypothetical protein
MPLLLEFDAKTIGNHQFSRTNKGFSGGIPAAAFGGGSGGFSTAAPAAYSRWPVTAATSIITNPQP